MAAIASACSLPGSLAAPPHVHVARVEAFQEMVHVAARTCQSLLSEICAVSFSHRGVLVPVSVTAPSRESRDAVVFFQTSTRFESFDGETGSLRDSWARLSTQPPQTWDFHGSDQVSQSDNSAQEPGGASGVSA